MDTSKHANRCSVCKHPEKAAIEHAYINCRRRSLVEREYELPRDSLNRHAKYFALDKKRKTEDILWLVVESGVDRLKEHPATPAHLNDAIKTIAKLRGELVDRTEDITKALHSASIPALEFYRSHGRLPTPEEEARLSPEPPDEQ